ncbi:MAG: ORF6N domain-containing protein [Crocinitomicaceae bacterium]|nr:ORF6N domain-containing protein [Crocinitomicaceae bacterium]NCA22560.1 ORF6N domain-containing protein [Crocinitomicaceae bacterium]
MLDLAIIEEKLLEIRNKKVLLDRDVAHLYGIETKRVNEAVKNNPEKFSEGYVIYLDEEETEFLRSKISTLEIRTEPVEKFDRFQKLKHSTVRPKAFTDKGLYMLATILKSPKATETTIAIIETYSKLKQFSKAIQSISVDQNENSKQDLMQKGNELLAEILEDEMQIDETETSIEFNFALLKLKHTVKRKK